jgi:hypothetical protein
MRMHRIGPQNCDGGESGSDVEERGVWTSRVENWQIDELIQKERKKREDKYEEVEIHRGGFKQNNLRQGFCLLSFNFNCLFSLTPSFDYLHPAHYTPFDLT